MKLCDLQARSKMRERLERQQEMQVDEEAVRKGLGTVSVQLSSEFYANFGKVPESKM